MDCGVRVRSVISLKFSLNAHNKKYIVMQTHSFFRFWHVIGLGVLVALLWVACQKDSFVYEPTQSEQKEFENFLPLDSMVLYGSLPDTLAQTVLDSASDRSWPILYTPSPLKGCPNSTFYVFQVYDAGVGPQISVKFTTPTGGTIFAPMTRWGSYQIHSRTLSTKGRYKVQYVWTSSQSPVSSQYWWIDNTAVSLNPNGLSHIYWPFGSDGSSSWNPMGWNMSCGHGCNAHQNADYNAEDWNRSWNGNGNADYLHDFRSPLDGKVVNIEYRPSTYGHMVDIEQTVGTQKVWFRIAHLNNVNVQVGNIVYGGTTLIGRIGCSGNVSPPGVAGAHAHCALYKVNANGSNGGSIDFDFDASCN